MVCPVIPVESPPKPSPYSQEAAAVSTAETSQINDYMGLSIFTLLFCCLPIGIFALINSVKVREAKLVGNQARASEASTAARHLNFSGIVIGLFILPVIIVLNVVKIKSS
ncbi:uncharacterized protein LOC134192709 [Corticium candelabrum]|uniref:uncharacterized protein LOC134192709 n=1 Tax=Corticium candelabrum TaxID=121492 RepID=UPI002E2768F2|nr:uncharacterized protein LOC134192709 [Corticium candelabrum]